MQHVVKHFEMRGERAFEEHCQRAVIFASKKKKKKRSDYTSKTTVSRTPGQGVRLTSMLL